MTSGVGGLVEIATSAAYSQVNSKQSPFKAGAEPAYKLKHARRTPVFIGHGRCLKIKTLLIFDCACFVCLFY